MKHSQMKAVTTYGVRDWKSALPGGAGAAQSDVSGYVPLRSKAAASVGQTVLKLDERGLSQMQDGLSDLAGAVQAAVDEAASSSRTGRLPGTAEPLAVWEVPIPAGVADDDRLAFCMLAYQFVVRSAGLDRELCGTADGESLKIWFVPMAKGARGEAALSARNLMSRNDYLALYAELKDYLAEELGYGVDVDADDVMYRDMGYTADERAKAIAERDGMAKAASDLGDALKGEAQAFAKGVLKNFRAGL